MAKQGPKADCHTVLPEELLGMDYDAMAKRFAMTNQMSSRTQRGTLIPFRAKLNNLGLCIFQASWNNPGP